MLLGDGLLTAEGEAHLRQRRLIQPAFHKERIAGLRDRDDRVRRPHRALAGRTARTLDIDHEMMQLTLAIVGKTLFNTDVEGRRARSGRRWPTSWPRSGSACCRSPTRSRSCRFRRCAAPGTPASTLDRIVYGMIAERRKSPGDRGDLLSMLILAQDDEDNGRGMTDQQVRDEAITLFLAGHETTANALAWTWYLLSQSPAVEAQLHAELDRVLDGRAPTMADIPALGFVEQVVMESMRLYPPAWIIGRRAIEDYQIDDYPVAKGSIIITSPYITQRDRDALSRTRTNSTRHAGRRSSKRSCRRSPTSRSAAAHGAASASRSPGWN